MVPVGHGIFVQFADELDSRVLHPAEVIGMGDKVFTAELEKDVPAFDSGDSIIVYYKKKEFTQQCARIVSLIDRDADSGGAGGADDACGPIFEFELTGEPASAESRQYYRVSTVMAELTAKLGLEDSCKLLDVSTRGFSVIASEQHAVGEIVDATLRFEGQELTGKACIQSVRELNGGRVRYGLHPVGDPGIGSKMFKMLHHMSMTLQKQQLQRLAGVH